MLVTCLSHAYHMPITCLLHADTFYCTSILHVLFMPALMRLSAVYMSTAPVSYFVLPCNHLRCFCELLAFMQI